MKKEVKHYRVVQRNRNYQEINNLSQDIFLNTFLLGIISLGTIVSANNLIKNFNILEFSDKFAYIAYIIGFTGHSIWNFKNLLDKISDKADLEKINEELISDLGKEISIDSLEINQEDIKVTF